MFKKALLIVVVTFSALVFLAVAVAGVAATAGLATAAAVISESGVVEAFEDVAAGAEQLQIELDENSITFTNPDSGESRTVTSSYHTGRGRVEFSLPEITISDADGGESVVFSPGLRGEGKTATPRITITDPDNGQSRVIIPNADGRAPRIVWDGEQYYGPEFGLRLVGDIFSGLFTLTALVLIAAGAVLLLRNRRRDQDKVEPVKGDDHS